jgi:hypothetical protein
MLILNLEMRRPPSESPRATEENTVALVAAQEPVDDNRFSRQQLLLKIARDLAPTLINKDEDVSFNEQQMRAIDREFAAWPVRYATPNWAGYNAPDEELEREEASIAFTWLAPCDVFCHDENVAFEIWEDMTGRIRVDYAHWLSSEVQTNGTRRVSWERTEDE